LTADFLESQEVFEGLLVTAPVTDFIAREIGKASILVAEADEGVREPVLLELRSSELVFAMFVHPEVQNVGFEVAAAPLAPLVGDEFVDEIEFDATYWGEVGVVFLAHLVELGVVLGAQDDELGCEAVLEGVFGMRSACLPLFWGRSIWLRFFCSLPFV
jgi:hypothetical protein